MSDSTKPLGCDKNITGDQLAALRGIKSDDMKALINSKGTSTTCKNELTFSLDTATARNETTDVWLENTLSGGIGWGGATASNTLNTGVSTSNSNLTTRNQNNTGVSSGCRQTLMNIAESNSLYSQLTCNFKTSTSKVKSDIKMGATISVIAGPTELMVTQHEREMAGINEVMLELARIPNPTAEHIGLAKEMTIQKREAKENFRFDVKNSSFRITNKNVQTLLNTANQELEHTSQIHEAIVKKAKAEAVSAVTQKFEMGAQASSDLESYVNSKLDETSLSTTQDMVEQVNDTGLEIDMSGNITLRINGSITNVDVDITQGNLVQLRTELLMQAATKLGKEVSNNIVQDATTQGKLEVDGKGLADLEKAIAAGLAALAEAQKPPPGGGGPFGWLSGLFSGMFGKIAMIAIAVIVILILFSMFGFKIALIVGLIFGIYVAIAYFIGMWPFSKEKNTFGDPGQAIYNNLRTHLINPRLSIIYLELANYLANEIERLKIMPTSSSSLKDILQLKATYQWLKDAAQNPKPFSFSNRGWYSPEPPVWLANSISNFEHGVFTTLVNGIEDVLRSEPDGSEYLLAAKLLLPQLRRDLQMIEDSLNHFSPITEVRLHKDAENVVITNTRFGPQNWSMMLKEYGIWISAGRPKLEKWSQIRMTAYRESQNLPYTAVQNMNSNYVADVNYGINSNANANYGINSNANANYGINANANANYGINSNANANYGINSNANSMYAASPSIYTNSTGSTLAYNRAQNSNIVGSLGGEVAHMVQREYARKDHKYVKPVYNRSPNFRN
jgi:hypothetical protein